MYINKFFCSWSFSLSQSIYVCIFLYRLELNNQPTIVENQESNLTSDELTVTLKKAYVIYQQAFENIKDIKFIVELLNIAKDYDNTENLQKKMIWYRRYFNKFKLNMIDVT